MIVEPVKSTTVCTLNLEVNGRQITDAFSAAPPLQGLNSWKPLNLRSIKVLLYHLGSKVTRERFKLVKTKDYGKSIRKDIDLACLYSSP